MPLLTRGKVLITNWHVFEPQVTQVGGISSKVKKLLSSRKGTINIAKAARARHALFSLEDLERQVAASMLTILEEERDKQGNLKKIKVESVRYVESETALINRVLGEKSAESRTFLF